MEEREKEGGGGLPFHEVDHVDDAGRADHGLVGEDGPHGLFHAELRLQGGQEGLDFLPEECVGGGKTDNLGKSELGFEPPPTRRGHPPYPAAFEHPRVHQVGAHQGHVDAVLLRRLQLVAQRLVEADGTELTGAVVLGERRENKLAL